MLTIFFFPGHKATVQRHPTGYGPGEKRDPGELVDFHRSPPPRMVHHNE